MKIAILGRKKDTGNYESFFSHLPASVFTTLSQTRLSSCSGLILPGGGDITPAFFGERNNGSRNIDTELDILQFQALDYCIRRSIPVFGICKGMQLINIAFGGTIFQNLTQADLHSQKAGSDRYHTTVIAPSSPLFSLYGSHMTVNSAHHQGIKKTGKNLRPIQWSEPDGCIEAILHDTLPIIGLQWHPERLDPALCGQSGEKLLSYFASLTK